MIAKIALNIPFSEPYDYLIPSETLRSVTIGKRALVSFGHRHMIGVIVGICETSNVERLKELVAIVDPHPLFDVRMMSFCRWIADYYLCAWGEVLEIALPSGLKPGIVKTISIQKSHKRIEKLTDSQKTWLKKIDGLKEFNLMRSRDFPKWKNGYASLKKDGVIRFNYTISIRSQLEETEEWLELNEHVAGEIKTRPGYGPFTILEIMRREPLLKRKELIQRVPELTSALSQLIRKKAIQVTRKPVVTEKPQYTVNSKLFFELNSEQRVVVDQLRAPIREGEFQCYLLRGITGSGKTEVYLNAVRETILREKSVLILIPEISLTPQAVSRFRERFGGRIAVLHSGMAEKERRFEWWKIKHQICDIVIGARSAIFAPLKNIGLIVVDEEHDSSYKQQETPFYNARDLAVKIASDQNAVVILGSATPSLESFHNASVGKYTLLTLTKRANLNPLPNAEIINLKEEKRQPGVFYLSRHLVERLRENLARGKQALIFLNRRGYSSFISCKSCELPVLCANCSIAMTWHRDAKRLICHHCAYTLPFPAACPTCSERSLRLEGFGTQRVERDLRILFPDARFLRMDRDTVKGKGVLERSIDRINRRDVDFIIGTQLISKGHDFKFIGIVCVIMADMGLNIPDFRSSERIFQLISQVSGRAGRGKDVEGLTLIQSYNPGHYAVKTATDHDYHAFFSQEIKIRRELNNPPFMRQILIRVSDRNPDKAQISANDLGAILNSESTTNQFQVLGPVESPIHKINNRFYWQLLLKGNNNFLKKLLRSIFWGGGGWKTKGSTRITLDVDPYSMI